MKKLLFTALVGTTITFTACEKKEVANPGTPYQYGSYDHNNVQELIKHADKNLYDKVYGQNKTLVGYSVNVTTGRAFTNGCACDDMPAICGVVITPQKIVVQDDSIVIADPNATYTQSQVDSLLYWNNLKVKLDFSNPGSATLIINRPQAPEVIDIKSYSQEKTATGITFSYEAY